MYGRAKVHNIIFSLALSASVYNFATIFFYPETWKREKSHLSDFGGFGQFVSQ